MVEHVGKFSLRSSETQLCKQKEAKREAWTFSMAGVRPNNMEKHQGSVSLEIQRLCKGMHLESDHGGLIIKGIFY